MKDSTALPITWVVLRILLLINWLSGAGIFALLIAMIVAEPWTFRALGITDAAGLPVMVGGARAIAALGLIAIPLYHVVFTRLLAIVETVRRGDAFIRTNAYRLNAIAWALLALQLLSLVIAGVCKAIETPPNALHLDAGFSAGGWLAVLFAFILTRVFAEGTLMREDLEGTV